MEGHLFFLYHPDLKLSSLHDSYISLASLIQLVKNLYGFFNIKGHWYLPLLF